MSTVVGITEAHDRQAWKALGYESWKGYITKEFKMSKKHSYRLLNQGHVIKALSDATDTRVGPELSHRQVERIKPRLVEVTETIEEKVAEGMEPREAIREVVDSSVSVICIISASPPTLTMIEWQPLLSRFVG